MTGLARVAPNRGSDLLRTIVESRGFNLAITIVIVVNAVTLGLETWPRAMDVAGPLLLTLDAAALWIFTVELGLKLWVYRRRFFGSAWNIFDLAVVAIAWIPSGGSLSVLRALRILRVLRLVSVVPQMRTVVGALFRALPGMGSIVAVLALVFYVAAVMATKLFGGAFPEFFGSIGASMYSLFQVMTLESWSMGIVRPVMEEFPNAWAFFVPFIILTSFTVLNLFIALIVNSMQTLNAATDDGSQVDTELRPQIDALAEEVRQLRTTLAALGPVDHRRDENI